MWFLHSSNIREYRSFHYNSVWTLGFGFLIRFKMLDIERTRQTFLLDTMETFLPKVRKLKINSWNLLMCSWISKYQTGLLYLGLKSRVLYLKMQGVLVDNTCTGCQLNSGTPFIQNFSRMTLISIDCYASLKRYLLRYKMSYYLFWRIVSFLLNSWFHSPEKAQCAVVRF